MSIDLADFPESQFSCDPSLQPNCARRAASGAERMANATAVFCGLARDVREALPRVSARIERAGKMFRDYRVVIFENDSHDGTLGYLWAWQQENGRVEVISEILGTPRWGQVQDMKRMDQMADCRNRYLRHAIENHGDCDFLIVLDTDLPQGFSYDGFVDTFGHDDWDMVGANGILVQPDDRDAQTPVFYDAWAYRREGETTVQPYEITNRLVFRRGSPLVPVWSCFGGLAVYRMEAIRAGVSYGSGDCEHVVLHRQMRHRGFGRQFLNPSLIVLYSIEK
jgi:hypothetical protein